MSAKDQILELLAAGVSQVAVAEAAGVTESYVSQLLGEEDFAAALASKRAEVSAADIAFDKKLESAEETALDNIEKKLHFGNLQQSLQAFKILNGAKRRKDSHGPQQQTAGLVVNLILPQVAIPQYVVNAQNEIVEVEGKTMVSATPKGLNEIVAKRKGEEVPKLPTPDNANRALEVLEVAEKVKPRQSPKNVPNLADLL